MAITRCALLEMMPALSASDLREMRRLQARDQHVAHRQRRQRRHQQPGASTSEGNPDFWLSTNAGVGAMRSVQVSSRMRMRLSLTAQLAGSGLSPRLLVKYTVPVMQDRHGVVARQLVRDRAVEELLDGEFARDEAVESPVLPEW